MAFLCFRNMPRKNSVSDLQLEEEQVAPSPIRRSSRIIARRTSSNAESDDDSRIKLQQNSTFTIGKGKFLAAFLVCPFFNARTKHRKDIGTSRF